MMAAFEVFLWILDSELQLWDTTVDLEISVLRNFRMTFLCKNFFVEMTPYPSYHINGNSAR